MAAEAGGSAGAKLRANRIGQTVAIRVQYPGSFHPGEHFRLHLVLFCYYNNDTLENINIIKIISNIKYLLRNIDFSYYDNDFNSNYKLKRQ